MKVCSWEQKSAGGAKLIDLQWVNAGHDVFLLYFVLSGRTQVRLLLHFYGSSEFPPPTAVSVGFL